MYFSLSLLFIRFTDSFFFLTLSRRCHSEVLFFRLRADFRRFVFIHTVMCVCVCVFFLLVRFFLHLTLFIQVHSLLYHHHRPISESIKMNATQHKSYAQRLRDDCHVCEFWPFFSFLFDKTAAVYNKWKNVKDLDLVDDWNAFVWCVEIDFDWRQRWRSTTTKTRFVFPFAILLTQKYTVNSLIQRDFFLLLQKSLQSKCKFKCKLHLHSSEICIHHLQIVNTFLAEQKAHHDIIHYYLRKYIMFTKSWK